MDPPQNRSVGARRARLRDESETPTADAASACVLLAASSVRTAVSLSGLMTVGRPPTLPASRAAAMPDVGSSTSRRIRMPRARERCRRGIVRCNGRCGVTGGASGMRPARSTGYGGSPSTGPDRPTPRWSPAITSMSTGTADPQAEIPQPTSPNYPAEARSTTTTQRNSLASGRAARPWSSAADPVPESATWGSPNALAHVIPAAGPMRRRSASSAGSCGWSSAGSLRSRSCSRHVGARAGSRGACRS